jgi:uncharacterized protein YprB with RNaseH-like and TPR domain
VCDNFYGGAFDAPFIPRKGRTQVMNVELDQEYTALKDKVRELREYL